MLLFIFVPFLLRRVFFCAVQFITINVRIIHLFDTPSMWKIILQKSNAKWNVLQKYYFSWRIHRCIIENSVLSFMIQAPEKSLNRIVCIIHNFVQRNNKKKNWVNDCILPLNMQNIQFCIFAHTLSWHALWPPSPYQISCGKFHFRI